MYLQFTSCVYGLRSTFWQNLIFEIVLPNEANANRSFCCDVKSFCWWYSEAVVREVFCKTVVLENFAKFTGKHLFRSLFFNDTHRNKLCFIQFSIRMASWLPLTIIICLRNQLGFNTSTLKQIFWKKKTFFKKLEYHFLVETTKIENALFPYKTAISEGNFKTNRMVTTKRTYHEDWSFASTYFIVSKILF